MSNSFTFRSHPHGAIDSSLLFIVPLVSIRFIVSRSTSSTPLPLPFMWRRRSRADSISATSTKSPSCAHNAGRNPKSAYRSRAAFGGVKWSLPAAKTKSCSGLKICSVIINPRFLLQRYDKNRETVHTADDKFASSWRCRLAFGQRLATTLKNA